MPLGENAPEMRYRGALIRPALPTHPTSQIQKRPLVETSGLCLVRVIAADYSAAFPVMSASIGLAISAPVALRRSSRISSSRDVAMRRIWLI